MRFVLIALLASVMLASEAADQLTQRINAGFSAWMAAGGSGKAACALWTDGALPAAGAQADVVAAQLDAVPAASRKPPQLTGPIQSTIANETATTTKSTVFLATIDLGGQSLVLGFSYSGTPPRLASMAAITGASSPRLQDQVKTQVLIGMAGGRPFNPGRRTMSLQPTMSDDALGPYTITGPAGVTVGKLVLWGPAVGKPVEIPIGSELSLVSLSFTAGAKPAITCRWTPASGAEGSRELPLIGSVPDPKNRSSRMTGASTLEQLKAHPPIGQTFEQVARGRDPLPPAWLAWFEISWGELPADLSVEQAITAPLPQAIVLTME